MATLSIDPDSIRKAAILHDVRSAERIAEHGKAAVKKEELGKYKAELLQKVNDHIQDLEKLEHKKADLAKLKEELLKRVDEHIQIETLRQEDLAKFKDEMLERVQKFMETGKV